MTRPGALRLPALRDIRAMSGEGHVRVVTPPPGAGAGPPRLLTLVRIGGDTTVCVDRTWLNGTPPDEVLALARGHFAEVQGRMDGLATALHTLWLVIGTVVGVAEVALVGATWEPLLASGGAVLAALRDLASGEFAAAAHTAAPVLDPTLGGLAWPLLPPLAGWGVRKAVTLALRWHFLSDRTNGRTGFRLRRRKDQPITSPPST